MDKRTLKNMIARVMKKRGHDFTKMIARVIKRNKGKDFICIYLEGDAKKIEQIFFYIVFLILMIMLFCVYIFKLDTLIIPKW